LAGGLGLGVFIATTLIERTGGKVKFGTSPQGGAQVKLVWQMSKLDLHS
jgi:two-component system sensor histidine kinase RegB